MSTAKIQTGDTVQVISGNYRGTVGVVTKVIITKARNGLTMKRASVSTVPKIAKYRKSQSVQGTTYPGQKFDIDRTIDLSNLNLFTGLTISKSKIELKNGKKVRVYKKTSETVTKEKVSKIKAAPQLETDSK